MRTRYVILIILVLVIATILTQPKLSITPPPATPASPDPATARDHSSPREGDEKANGFGTS
ncbi:hypothetical protein EZJ49_12785 [Bdellovibrio bacteriovorus]|uniref:hypothetical protein n=1 Tax=Bdellovibrio bacteriovorus TaxID=959 RepID=UPI0021D25D44|nr:hypothetical protein [Bdellovibrio bacteriovorus]UXR63941.1 hypothetical protein EZJ49_12785 [Bdellovibrio bacteriovorus]